MFRKVFAKSEFFSKIKQVVCKVVGNIIEGTSNVTKHINKFGICREEAGSITLTKPLTIQGRRYHRGGEVCRKWSYDEKVMYKESFNDAEEVEVKTRRWTRQVRGRVSKMKRIVIALVYVVCSSRNFSLPLQTPPHRSSERFYEHPGGGGHLQMDIIPARPEMGFQ